MIQKIKQYINRKLSAEAVYIIQKYGIMLVFLALYVPASAQQKRDLSINEAIKLGIENSKTLKLSKLRVEEAVSRYNQTKDNALPTGKVSYMYNHAEIPTNTLKFGNEDIHLPARADAYLGTFTLEELIFAGNKLKYAKESTDLLTKVAALDVEKNQDELVYAIINAYYNLYKIQQSKKVVDQNIQAVDKQLKQAQRFFSQGLVTKNDVLRFQLQRSNVELTGIDLEANRKIVNYNLNILLGLPEDTEVNVSSFTYQQPSDLSLNGFIDAALANRTEIKGSDLQSQLAEKNIKSIKADLMPTLGVGISAYYVNASGKFIPPANTFVTPITGVASLSWNFDRLWLNKNKIAEAKIQKTEADLSKGLATDNIKTDVNKSYRDYQTSLDKIKVLETAIEQARENDKILESKYNNNIASVTDRIDAETQLYQTLINLEIAKADAGLAYYSLLKSTGTISKINF
ncbi:TolC family protein (plasmid) [Pedobacter sp. BS3]|uniref:TolC family protein n=1 Tax=Pedobacter sp. BS3 TaxID=2567937 RepID=UPI0011ED03DC|nr:TolC family protein [Pedobacter sp. BS3]TZF85882.1 TolC family protein [Pedobacter sp. BS3]